MKATIFGAGNIGRGLVGYALERAGYELTFVDVDTNLISALAANGAYTIRTDGGVTTTVAVAAAIPAADDSVVEAAVAQSDVIATAVGAAILPAVAGPIAAGLAATTRSEVNVVACENVHPNSTLLREHVADRSPGAETKAGFPNVVVDRIVPVVDDPLEVLAEEHFEFTVHRTEWRGPLPETDDVEFVDDLAPIKLRKLWLVNGLHAATAWLGIAGGHDTIADAIADEAIRTHIESIADGMIAALESRHPGVFEEGALERYAAASMKRFSSTAIPDTTHRVARNPLQKLGRDERLVDPALAAAGLGRDVTSFGAAIAAALALRTSDVEGAEALNRHIEERGWPDMFSDEAQPESSQQLVESVTQQMTTAQPSEFEQEIVIKNPAGLHARPAAMVVEHAKSLDADIVIRKGEKKANAKSIMSVLALGGSTGDVVTVTTSGPQAREAMDFVHEVLTTEEEA